MNLTKNQPKVLFFLADAVPTDEETEAMNKLLGAHILPRNASFIGPDDNPEKADAVAGAVPHAYRDYPKVTTAAQARAIQDKNDKRAAKAADEAAELPGDLEPGKVPASVTPPPVGMEGKQGDPNAEKLGGSKDYAQHAHVPGTPSGAGLPPDGEKLGGAPVGAPAAASQEATHEGADGSTGAGAGDATRPAASATPPNWGGGSKPAKK